GGSGKKKQEERIKRREPPRLAAPVGPSGEPPRASPHSTDRVERRRPPRGGGGGGCGAVAPTGCQKPGAAPRRELAPGQGGHGRVRADRGRLGAGPSVSIARGARTARPDAIESGGPTPSGREVRRCPS